MVSWLNAAGPDAPLEPLAIHATFDVATAWQACADLFCRAVSPSPEPPSQEMIERELTFCLLGGFGIPYELADSAAATLIPLCPFHVSWEDDDLLHKLHAELSRPQFKPQTPDGKLRRYRFPNRKARLIVEARRWMLAHDDLSLLLRRIDCEQERRRFLCGCPGLGYKTATWLLRNLGLAKRLAILDIHVFRAMQAAGWVRDETLPRDYEQVETAFLNWCDQLGAPPAAFDLFVWEWQRGSLGTLT